MEGYEAIDLQQTGQKLYLLMVENGYGVSDIQRLMCLGCPQPVYRWLSGKILPSVEHLYNLSRVFHVHMEELLVGGKPEPSRRLPAYRVALGKGKGEATVQACLKGCSGRASDTNLDHPSNDRRVKRCYDSHTFDFDGRWQDGGPQDSFSG